MGDLKTLMAGYIADEVDTAIGEWIDREGYQDLFDVKVDRKIIILLGLETLSLVEFRRTLFDKGYLVEVPIKKMIDDIGSSITNPYLDPRIVGEKVEEHRKQVVESDEFGRWVCERYDSLFDVERNGALKNYLDPKLRVNSLRKAMFEAGLLTEFPVGRVFRGGSMKRRTAPYLNPKIVGDMVEYYRGVILRSDELREWVGTRFDSLYDVGNERALASILGVSTNRTKIRGALYGAGIFTEIPIALFLQHIGDSIMPLYIDPRVVGDDVELNREKILRSDEFGDYIRANYPTLDSISATNKWGLARLLGVDRRIVAVREELVRRGFYE